MDDMDKQAREFLACAYEADEHGSIRAQIIRGDGEDRTADKVAMRAIRSALTTAPEGFALVPVEPNEAMLDAATDHDVGGHCYMCSIWACSEGDAATIWAAMLIAAKELGNG